MFIGKASAQKELLELVHSHCQVDDGQNMILRLLGP